ncbi:MAG: NAD(P)-dependent oxidoreductase [bacterium]|nr:NAD(P)-dependent oxidoreductase [bacterium]
MPKISKKLEYEKRKNSFDEIYSVLGIPQAIAEANRCLFCWEAPCREGCPVGINIPGFIKRIAQKNFKGAAELIYMDNPFGEVCGRICPQEKLCEEHCRAQALNYPISIGELQRFVCNMRVKGEFVLTLKKKKAQKEKIAIIGAGPGGLGSAYFLSLSGYQVDVYEKQPNAGGILRYFLPAYRLPSSVIAKEFEFIKELGVNFIFNSELGKNINLKELKKKYDAVILAIGLTKYKKLGLKGEDNKGVFYPDYVLNTIRNMKDPIPDSELGTGKILVIGGGNVAMDCADMLSRLPDTEVEIVYRRDFHNMPAWKSEVDAVLNDGVRIKFLTNPVEIISDKGKVTGLKCVRMKLSEPDSSGRPRPVPVEGSEHIIQCDAIVIAIGQDKDSELLSKEGLELSLSGELILDTNMQTSESGVFAIGDLVTGPLTAVNAIQSGKEVSSNIYNYFESRRK